MPAVRTSGRSPQSERGRRRAATKTATSNRARATFVPPLRQLEQIARGILKRNVASRGQGDLAEERRRRHAEGAVARGGQGPEAPRGCSRASFPGRLKNARRSAVAARMPSMRNGYGETPRRRLVPN